MKILTTQLTGLLQRVSEHNEESFEETARLLAQATVGEGRVFIAGFDELLSVVTTAVNGVEPLKGAQAYEPDIALTSADRVWLFTRSVHDDDALSLAKRLDREGVPFAAFAAEKPTETYELLTYAHTYIWTGLTRGLLPGELGNRIVQPHAFAGLFVLEAVKLIYDEILEDE